MERRARELMGQISHSPPERYEQKPLHGGIVGSENREACPEWRLPGGCLWVVVSLCFGEVGLAVSEATTAHVVKNTCFSCFFSLGFIDWFIDC